VVSLHPNRPAPGAADFPFFLASLDHAIWFHRPLRADRWHVHDFTCQGVLSSRGLAVGSVFTPDGTHVASIAQEVLLRERRG
jgi:acyl-CoA thioesterase-2